MAGRRRGRRADWKWAQAARRSGGGHAMSSRVELFGSFPKQTCLRGSDCFQQGTHSAAPAAPVLPVLPGHGSRFSWHAADDSSSGWTPVSPNTNGTAQCVLYSTDLRRLGWSCIFYCLQVLCIDNLDWKQVYPGPFCGRLIGIRCTINIHCCDFALRSLNCAGL